MLSENPWEGLVPPHNPDAISARRVDSDLPWGFFWARSLDDHYLLVLRHGAESSPHGSLPKLRGIEMYLSEDAAHGTRTLVLQLDDATQRDIFHRLCLDIVAAAGGAPTESDAVKLFLARTWRWHHLLRGGGDARLTVEEQKGLIGELIVLERLVLPCHALSDPVSTWHGPLGSPKDFEIGRICIEAKARRGAATPYIAISSEHQLDRSGVDLLFLHVAELAQEQSKEKVSATLTDIVIRTRTAVAARDMGALQLFESLLAATGFRWEDDYTAMRWAEGKHHIFGVTGSFPALTAASCPSGVSNVRYSLSLAECEGFSVSDDVVIAALTGDTGGH